MVRAPILAHELERGTPALPPYFEELARTRATGPQAASYPCARLRNWPRQTFWRYSLGTALLFRQYPVLTIELCYGVALVRARSQVVIPRAEYESEVTIDCYSEKRVVRASGQAARPPERELGGPQGEVQDKNRFALTQSIIVFRAGS